MVLETVQKRSLTESSLKLIVRSARGVVQVCATDPGDLKRFTLQTSEWGIRRPLMISTQPLQKIRTGQVVAIKLQHNHMSHSSGLALLQQTSFLCSVLLRRWNTQSDVAIRHKI